MLEEGELIIKVIIFRLKILDILSQVTLEKIDVTWLIFFIITVLFV